MIDRQPYVLVTRPAESAARFAVAVADLGYSPIVSPLTEHRATGNSIPPGPFSALIVTSQAVLRYVAPDARLASLAVFTVGEKTAQACRETGFSHAVCLGETVPALVKTLAVRDDMPGTAPLLYVSAARVSHDLAALLAPLGLKVVRVPLYAARDRALSQDAIHHLCGGSIAWITLFSRHTAAALASEIERLDTSGRTDGIALACLAPGIAAEVGHLRWRRVEVASRPTEAALLACLARGMADGEQRGADER